MCENPTSYYQDREGHMFAFPVLLVARIWTWAPLLANETKESSVLILLQTDLKEEVSCIALGCEHLKSQIATAVLQEWGYLRLKANILRMAKWKDTHYLHFQSYHWPTLKCEVKWKLLSSVRLCDPVDCSPPGSSIHGISQARILEWVAVFFSRSTLRCPRIPAC